MFEYFILILTFCLDTLYKHQLYQVLFQWQCMIGPWRVGVCEMWKSWKTGLEPKRNNWYLLEFLANKVNLWFYTKNKQTKSVLFQLRFYKQCSSLNVTQTDREFFCLIFFKHFGIKTCYLYVTNHIESFFPIVNQNWNKLGFLFQ